ncbi:MAG: hypothetical protein IKC01_03025 [Clostridia bacterium]|nr:hypothetical protein [Clostridia bacterium]
MKKDTTKKYAKIAGWILLIPNVLAIPTHIFNTIMLNSDIDLSITINYFIVVILQILLGAALIRCKKDMFLFATFGAEVLRSLVFMLINISSVTFLGAMSFVGNFLILLLIAVNCIPRFSSYKAKVNKLWFLPSVLLLSVSIIDFGKKLLENIANRMDMAQLPGASEEVMQSVTWGISISSGVIGLLPYFLMCFWFYESYKNEIADNNDVPQPVYTTATEITEVSKETE